MIQNNAINHPNIVLHQTGAAAIDFKSTGSTTIFTTPTGLAFIPMGIGYYGANVSGVTVPGIYNMGTNSTAFDNYVNGQQFNLTASGNFWCAVMFDIAAPETAYVPANTAFKINVTVGTTATSATANVFVWGFFVPDN